MHSFLLYLPWNTVIAYLTSTRCLEPMHHPLKPRRRELLWINVSMSPICMHLGMVTWGSNKPAIDPTPNIEYDYGLCAYLIVVFYSADQKREILDFCRNFCTFGFIGLPFKRSLCCIMQDSRFNYWIIQSIFRGGFFFMFFPFLFNSSLLLVHPKPHNGWEISFSPCSLFVYVTHQAWGWQGSIKWSRGSWQGILLQSTQCTPVISESNIHTSRPEKTIKTLAEAQPHVSGHIPLYSSIGTEGWINRSRRGPRCQQLSVKDCPWDPGTTELRCLDLSGFAHFDDYPASHRDHVNDQSSLLASCQGGFDHQTSILVAKLAAMGVWGIERPFPVWGSFFAN